MFERVCLGGGGLTLYAGKARVDCVRDGKLFKCLNAYQCTNFLKDAS